MSTFLLSPSECSLETSETSFLRADFPLFQRRGNRGLLTYKAQCFGTSVILLSPCQSDGASLQQTTGQWGWTLRLFHPYELTRIGLKSSLEKKKKSLSFSLHYKLLENTDGGDDRKSNYFSWASFLSGF